MQHFPIRHQGRTGYSILISGFGDEATGGGLFVHDGTAIEQADRISCTGLFVAGDRLLRSLRTVGTEGAGEIMVYDARGVERYLRVDALSDPHDLIWDGTHMIAASSARNCILWITPAGEIAREWRAPGEDDSWHLNSLTVRNGRLLACAFGQYRHYREWATRLDAGDGLLFDVESGEPVVTGLCGPHSVRRLDGDWVICNSKRNEILQISESTGEVPRRSPVGTWPRGLAITDDFIFVGESTNRHGSEGSGASVAVLSRVTLQLLGRFPVPCLEVYDLVVAPDALVQGVRNGFRTNPLRTAEQDQLWMFQQAGVVPTRLWATGEPLRAEECRAGVAISIAATWTAGELKTLGCAVTNRGSVILVSAPPNPVRLSYRWVPLSPGLDMDPSGGRGPSFPGRCRLETRSRATCRSRRRNAAVEYRLRVSLVQEGIAWFDDLDAENGCSATVRVEPGSQSDP